MFDIGFSGDFDRINDAVNIKFVEFDGESRIEGKDFVAYSKEDIKYLCNKYKNKTIISTHMHEYTKEQALKR